MEKTIALVSGGCDPLHPGHLRLFEDAKSKADVLIVALNSDEWLIRKKGKSFMPFAFRKELIDGMECVDEVISFDDSDNTATDALKQVRKSYPKERILFCNGGDRSEGNVPEEEIATNLRIELVYSVGGSYKLMASSELLHNYAYPSETRPWGTFIVLYDGEDYKMKELIINPGQCISKQYHYHRREIWTVLSGTGRVITDGKEKIITTGDHVTIEVGVVHKLINPGKLPLRIVEVQQGPYLEEDDIVRLDLDTLQLNDKYKGK